MNDISTSALSGFIFTWGTAVGRGTGHACSAQIRGCEITTKVK